MPPLYPIFLDLSARRVLVVGAGEVASRKIAALLEAGASVLVVAPEAAPFVRLQAEHGALEWRARPFADGDVEGASLAVAAASDPSVNRAAREACRRRGVPCNVVDVPELCDFHVPAVVDRGPIRIAISTGGRCPAFAGRLRRDVEAAVGERHARALEAVAALRERLKARADLDAAGRGERIRRVVESKAMDDFLSGRTDALELEGPP
jgi:precorrin-2 dehydrogenase/sirohydrochlorin ferrochelatase